MNDFRGTAAWPEFQASETAGLTSNRLMQSAPHSLPAGGAARSDLRRRARSQCTRAKAAAFALCGLSLLLMFAPACGYHVAGKGDRLPPDIQTIAIPIFVNNTKRYRIEQTMAADVTREFIERTRFRVTPNPAHADAVLRGTVKSFSAGIISFDPNTGRATSMQIQVIAGVELVDLHTKKVLFSNPNYSFTEQYQINASNPALFEEDQPAMERLSRDFAQTLVTDILENF